MLGAAHSWLFDGLYFVESFLTVNRCLGASLRLTLNLLSGAAAFFYLNNDLAWKQLPQLNNFALVLRYAL